MYEPRGRRNGAQGWGSQSNFEYLCVIRADGDGTETQDGTHRIFRKERTSETALVRGRDMGELSSQLKGTAPLLKIELRLFRLNKSVLQEETAGIEDWLD